MECHECMYWWRADEDEYAHCQWESGAPGDVPPCEDEPEDVDEWDYVELDDDEEF